MKIVVNSGVGIQNDRNSQIINYSGVQDNYSLSGLMDVTTFDTLSLFYNIGRFPYTGYRDSVNTYWKNTFTGNFTGVPPSNQITLAQLFLVDSGFRATVLSSGETIEWATTLVEQNSYAALRSQGDAIAYMSVTGINQTIVSGSGNVYAKFDKGGGLISGNTTISGNLTVSGTISGVTYLGLPVSSSGLGRVTTIGITGGTNISGDVAFIPSGITQLAYSGNNIIIGVSSGLGRVTSLNITGQSSISGNVALIPSGTIQLSYSGNNIILASPTSPSVIYNAQTDFGFVGDLVTLFEAVMNTGVNSRTLTTTISTPFAASDIGKRITVAGAGISSGQLTTTISGFTSSSSILLTSGCSASVSGVFLSYGTDNTNAINNMQTTINTTLSGYPGAKIYFSKSATNAYGFPIPVVFNKFVALEGIGGSFNTDNGDYTKVGGTRLAWWGTDSDGGVDFGAFFTFQPASGSVQALKSVSIKDLWFDGTNGMQNSALYGIRMAGCHGTVIENVYLIDFRAAGLLMNATEVSLNPTSDRGVLRPTLCSVFSRQLESFIGAVTTPITTTSAITLLNSGQNITVSSGNMPTLGSSYAFIQTNQGTPVLVKYTGGGTTTLNVKCSVADANHGYITVSGGNVVSASPTNASCMLFDGDATANCNAGSINLVQCSHGTTWGPAAICIRNSDSMDFNDMYINGGSPINDGAINRIRKEGVRLAGSNTNVGLSARNNTFRNGDPSSSNAAGVSSMSLLPTGAKMAFPAGPNYWDLMQLGNGARVPNVEMVATGALQGAAGASFFWTPNGGLKEGVVNLSIADQSPVAAVLTHIQGSLITIPPQGFQVGTTFRWTMTASKTAAGTAARTFHVRVGSTGSTSDAIVATLTMPVGTAAVDTGKFTLIGIMSAIGASANMRTALTLTHAGGSATVGGFTALSINSPVLIGTPTTFNSVMSGLSYLSVTVTTGAAEAITFQQVITEIIKEANP